MSDPLRWRESNDAPPGVADLLSEANKSSPMSDGQRIRSAMRLAKVASVPLAAGSVVTLGVKLAAAAWGVAVVGLVGAHLVGALTAHPGAQGAVREASRTAHVTAPLPALRPPVVSPVDETRDPPEPLPAGTSEPVASEPPPRAPSAPAERLVPQPTVTEPHPAEPADALAAEGAWLGRQRRLLAENPAAALAAADSHGRLFPQGQLGEECDVLAVEALQRLHRVDEAKARAEGLIERNPRGLYVGRMRTLLSDAPHSPDH